VEGFHALLPTDVLAVRRDLEDRLNILGSVLHVPELIESDSGLDHHLDGYLNLHREAIGEDHLLQSIVLHEVLDLLHAIVPTEGEGL